MEEGQLLARVDDRLGRDQLEIMQRKVAVAVSELAAAEKIKDEAFTRFKTQEQLFSKADQKGTSQEDLRGSQLVWETKKYEAEAKKAAVDVANLELKKAQTVLQMHEIRSPVGGTIREITKRRGEAVRNLETVFVIEEARPGG